MGRRSAAGRPALPPEWVAMDVIESRTDDVLALPTSEGISNLSVPFSRQCDGGHIPISQDQVT